MVAYIRPYFSNICRCMFWGKVDWCLGLTTLRRSCAECLEILGASNTYSPKDLFSFV